MNDHTRVGRAPKIFAAIAIGLVTAWCTLAVVDGGEGVAVLSGTDPGSAASALLGVAHVAARLGALVLAPPLAIAALLLAVRWRAFGASMRRRVRRS